MNISTLWSVKRYIHGLQNLFFNDLKSNDGDDEDCNEDEDGDDVDDEDLNCDNVDDDDLNVDEDGDDLDDEDLNGDEDSDDLDDEDRNGDDNLKKRKPIQLLSSQMERKSGGRVMKSTIWRVSIAIGDFPTLLIPLSGSGGT